MDVDEVVAWLRKNGTKANSEGLARYGIVAERPFGVSMTALQSLAKPLQSGRRSLG